MLSQYKTLWFCVGINSLTPPAIQKRKIFTGTAHIACDIHIRGVYVSGRGEQQIRRQGSLFDVLAAGHRVPHAGAGQTLHVLHDDEGCLLQGDDAQVVVVRLTVPKGVEARPDGILEGQGPVLPPTHL